MRKLCIAKTAAAAAAPTATVKKRTLFACEIRKHVINIRSYKICHIPALNTGIITSFEWAHISRTCTAGGAQQRHNIFVARWDREERCKRSRTSECVKIKQSAEISTNFSAFFIISPCLQPNIVVYNIVNAAHQKHRHVMRPIPCHAKAKIIVSLEVAEKVAYSYLCNYLLLLTEPSIPLPSISHYIFPLGALIKLVRLSFASLL